VRRMDRDSLIIRIQGGETTDGDHGSIKPPLKSTERAQEEEEEEEEERQKGEPWGRLGGHFLLTEARDLICNTRIDDDGSLQIGEINENRVGEKTD